MSAPDDPQDFVSDYVLDILSSPLVRESELSSTEVVQKARAVAPPLLPMSAADASSKGYASTGCDILDRLLGGGLPLFRSSLVEVAGKAGSGKTQFCLQLALSAVASDTSAYAIYVVTEGTFPGTRLAEIARNRFCSGSREAADSLTARVVVEKRLAPDALEEWATNRLPWLLRQTGAKVVIVDSIAAPFRHELDDNLQRAQALVRTANSLVAAMRTVGGVVVCVNHVTQKMAAGVGAGGGVGGGAVAPALGHSWEVCVAMKIFIDRDEPWIGTRRMRKFRLAHAPHLPSGAVGFEVDEFGVTGISDNNELA